MSPIKWLNYFLFIEKIFGVHRNYCDQNRMTKFLIILQIFAQTMWHSVIILIEGSIAFSGTITQRHLIFESLYASSYLNCVFSIVIGTYYNRAFKSYYKSITRVYGRFKDEKKPVKSLNKIFCFGITFNSVSAVLAVIRSVEGFIRFLNSQSLIFLLFGMISTILIRITILCQHFMLFVVIIMVVYYFKCLTASIVSAQERLRSCEISIDIKSEQIQEWVELYRHLVNCCDKISVCFGHQYLFSLTSSLVQYTFLAYVTFYMNFVEKSQDFSSIVLILYSYMTMMIMPIVAAQMASNDRVKFHRALIRLYNTMIKSGGVELRLIKDFIRLIQKNSLEIKLMTKLPAGMFMLPVIITLVVNYLIIMLQFNHII